ncbi:MAG: glycosyltransferase family 2 protein [Geobacteraceae bacterium]|nr:glycosyltransferase family 2 protein [Geobacteraceae bacterium]
MGCSVPIAFLVFNRPETTTRVFDAIRAARPSRLLVVADGPRSDRAGEDQLCAAVRRITEQVDWPCTVERNYAEQNMGCGERVSSGVDWVFSLVEEAIILEDDCLPHPDFFRFCTMMLERYREDQRVMMVGGTNYLLDRLALPDSYLFSRYFAIWGWATWRRAWQRYDRTMADWPRLRGEKQLSSLYSQQFMVRHLTRLFDTVFSGRLDTWDVQWFYSCLFNNGLSIVPGMNLISNIGVSGTHTGADTTHQFFPVFPLQLDGLRHPSLVYPDSRYDAPFFRMTFHPAGRSVVKGHLATIIDRVKGRFS